MAAVTCPEREILERLLLGQILGPEGEELARHLEGCARCLAAAESLSAQDTLTEAVCAGETEADSQEKEVVHTLIERLRDLRSREGSPTAAHAQPAAEQTQDLLTFLAAAEAPDELGRLGGYRVLQVLGTGGMGLVFRAEDVRLKRPVALKVMKPELAAKPDAHARFLREAQTAARVKHDHIAVIYQVGEDRDTPFLAMELLQGESLAARLERVGRLPVAEVLRIGREAAEGLAAAHAARLIHRDVKPGNLWLEGAAGRVKLLDFGLAKVDTSDTQLTRTGQLVGTPAYMAPEQARGEPVDARADLFSLGCVLYRASTGQVPFQGAEALSVLWALANQRPPAPRVVNREIPTTLSDLIERLLAKDPAARPASARAVADTLAAIEKSQGAAPRAAPPRRRLRLAVAAGLALVASLAALTVVIIRDRQGREVARIEVPEGGSVEVKDGGKGRNTAKEQPGKPGLRIEPAALDPLRPGEPLAPSALVQQPARLPGVRSWTIATRNADVPNVLAYRPDGKRLAVGSYDGAVRVWEPQTGRLVQVLLAPKDPTALAWSPDGRTLAVGTWEEKHLVRLWNAESGRLLRALEAPVQSIDLLAWSADGRSVLALGRNPNRSLAWNTADGKVLRNVPLAYNWPAAFSREGKQVAAAGQDGSLTIWDGEMGKEVAQLGKLASPLYGVAWSPDSKRLAGAEAKGLRVWDVEARKECFRHDQEIAPFPPSVSWSPEGRSLAYNLTGNQGVETIDVKEGARPLRLEDSGISLLAWSPDGTTIARGMLHLSYRTWLYDAATGKRTKALSETPPAWVAWSPDGRSVAVNDASQTTLASLSTGEVFAVLKDTRYPLAWAPDGSAVATSAPGKPTVLIHEAGGKLRHALAGHKELVNELAWSPDGKLLASFSPLEKRVLLWDAGKGEQLQEVGPLPGPAVSLGWWPDGRLLTVNVPEVGWHFWDIEKDRLANDPKAWKAINLVVGPDGRTAFVLPSRGASYRLRDLATGKDGVPLPYATSQPAAWSPDGRLLAVPVGGTVELWRGDLKRRVRTLRGPASPYLGRVGFTQDGALVLGLAGQGRLHVWEAHTGRLRGVLLLGEQNHGLTITPDGRYTGNEQVERGIVMVVQKDAGTQEVLEPADFEQKYGLKNEPDRVHLLQPLPPPLTVPEGQPLGPVALVREPAPLPDTTSWTIETRSARGMVRAVAYRPDGKLLATGGDDGTIRLWDTATGELVRMLVGDAMLSLSWSKDGRALVGAGPHGDTRLWDVDTGRLLRRLPPASFVTWSPHEPRLAITRGGELQLWDTAADKVLRTHVFAASIEGLAWSPDGKTIAVGLADKTARLWDLASAKETRTLEGHEAVLVRGLAWSPDGKRLATTAQVGKVREQAFRVWDTASGKLLGRFAVPCTDTAPAIAWSPDGKTVAVGLYQGPHGLFDPETGRLVRTLQTGHFASALAFSPDGRQVALAGDPGVCLRSAGSGKLIHALEGMNAMQSIQSLAWSPDGRSLALGYRMADQDSLRVVAAATGQRLPPRLADAWSCAAWSPDGKTLAAIAADFSVCLWDVASSRLVRTLEGKTQAHVLAWSPDGKLLAGGGSQKAWVWSADAGKLRWQTDKHQQLAGLAWSPDSRRLATTDSGDKGAVRLWEADTGKLLHAVPFPSGQLAWSPDSKALVAAPAAIAECIVIDVATGAVRVKTHNEPYLTCFHWSQDGKTFTAFRSGGQLRTWDAATGAQRSDVQLAPLPGGGAFAAWSPDRRVLARTNGFEVHLSDTAGLSLGVLLPGDPFQQLTITADGHYRGSARVERDIRIIVQKRDGTSETLSPAAFEHLYGWKNDPAKVRLTD
jgi:WD40 repeat protein